MKLTIQNIGKIVGRTFYNPANFMPFRVVDAYDRNDCYEFDVLDIETNWVTTFRLFRDQYSTAIDDPLTPVYVWEDPKRGRVTVTADWLADIDNAVATLERLVTK